MNNNEKLALALDRLTQIVEKMTPPIPAIPSIPAIPPIVATGDHDLLQKLDVKVDGLKDDIQKLNDGTKVTITDHEMRLRRLELWGALAIGFLYAIQIYLTFFKGIS